jgi:hypothetical protein
MHILMKLALSIGLTSAALIGRAAEPAPTPIAILDFDYLDTSGEARDQTAFHRQQLGSFIRSLGADLEHSQRFRLVTLRCEPSSCTTDSADTADLVAKARQSGARLLLFGGFHKASTLVQWAKTQVVDVETERIVFQRLMSFRGDDEQAWRRAEAFLAKDLLSYDWSGGHDLAE